MKRIVIFCSVILLIYLVGVVAINMPQKAKKIKTNSTITVPTPSRAQPTPQQKPDVSL